MYLHCRNAFDDMIMILKDYNYYNGIVHCFTGNADEAKVFIDLGFYIGITGFIFDKRRNAATVNALKSIPIDKILVETDAPWMPCKRSDKQSTPDI